jgi:hypothetical protein
MVSSQDLQLGRSLASVVDCVGILRRRGALTVLANFAAFGLCASFAFARNVHSLFFHFDGSYALIDVRNQLSSGHPTFEFSNNFLQSIGNIELTHNARLLFFYWPIAMFSDLRIGAVATYVVIAAIVFLAAYALGRLLRQPRSVALTAGWILGFLTTPFVPRPFFYEILAVAPSFVVVIATPVVIFWLLRRAGRFGALADLFSLVGLIAAAFYALAASLAGTLLVAAGSAAYAIVALTLAQRRSELARKLIVIAGALIVMAGLLWPWYAIGLFYDTAPYFFPADFSSPYLDATYASILFQGRQFGWAGPILVGLSVASAIFCLKSGPRELRAPALVLLACVLVFSGVAIALSTSEHWIGPPSTYVEASIWPLYAVFVAIAVNRLARLVIGRLGLREAWKKYRLAPETALLIPLAALAAFLIIGRPPTAVGYPFPPQTTAVVDVLRKNIGLDARSPFNGRIATLAPIVPGTAGDAWDQQQIATTKWAQSAGNDEMSLGLWYFHVPTLFEYNQLTSPAFHALIARTLQQPFFPYQRNITVLSYPNVRVLKLLGVRYVLMPTPKQPIGEVRATEDRGGQAWQLIELAQPNLATYSPTTIEVRPDLSSALDYVADDTVDLSEKAVALQAIGGPLTPIQSSALSMADEDLHIVARSSGRSLVVVPLEFSHCLSLHERHPGMGNGATLIRIDGLLSGIVFTQALDGVLSFRIGPLHNQLCRWRDFQELRAMLR